MFRMTKWVLFQMLGFWKRNPSGCPSSTSAIFVTSIFHRFADGDASDNPEQLQQLLQKIRRTRAYYIQCDHDGAVVALTSALSGAAPFAITQVALFLRRLAIAQLMPHQTCQFNLNLFD